MPTDDRLLLVRLEANTKRLESQLKRATDQSIRAARGIDTTWGQANRRIGQQLQRNAANFNRAGRSQGQFRSQVQNTAFQVQDLAVQISAGTDASRALGQQLPQLLGGFGALGAVIGAVVAVGLPLAATFIQSGENAGDLEKRVKDLIAAADEYTKAAKNAVIPTAELREKYGEASDAARAFLIELREISKVNAFDAVNEALDSLTSKLSAADFGVLNQIDPLIGVQSAIQEAARLTTLLDRSSPEGIIAQEQFDELNRAQDALRDLQIELNNLTDATIVTQDATLAVAQALDAVAQATGPTEQAQATQALLEVLTATLGTFDELTDEGQELFEQLTRAGEAAAAVAGGGSAATATISDAADQAERLAANLNLSAAEAARLSALERQGAFPGNLDGSTGTTRRATAPIRTRPRITLPPNPSDVQAEAEREARRARRGRGRGNRRRLNGTEAGQREIVQLERQLEALDKTGEELVELNAKYRLLDAAKRANLSLDKQSEKTGKTLRETIEEQAAAIAKLSIEYETAQNRIQVVQDGINSISQAFADAIVAGDSLGDAFKGVLRRMAADLIASGIAGALGSIFLGVGGSGGILGSLFAGFFDSGGRIPSGQFGIAGENGPEIVRGPAVVTSTADTARMMGGGASQVMVYLDVPAGVTVGEVQQISGNIAVQVVSQSERDRVETDRRRVAV